MEICVAEYCFYQFGNRSDRCGSADSAHDAASASGSYCFARGSERFHRWFCGTKLYQKHLDSFVKERAMTLKTKLCILLPASAMLILAFLMMQNLREGL